MNSPATHMPWHAHATAIQRGSFFYLLFWGSAGVYVPFLSVYFSKLGISDRQVGILMALVPLMTLAVSPLMSYQADRNSSHTRWLTLSLTLAVPSLLALAAANSFATAILAMTIFAACRGPAEPLADAIVASMATRYHFQYGKARLWGSLSFAILALLCGMLWQVWGYTAMFAVAALLSLPTALIASKLPQTPVGQRNLSVKVLLRDPVTATLTLTSLLTSGALVMHETFAGIYMEALGGSAIAVGAIWAITAFSELPTMRYANALMQRYSGVNALLLSYVLLFFTHLGYWLLPYPSALLALSILKGLGYGLFFIATVYTVHKRTPPEWSATALSVVLGVSTLGLARLLGSTISGFLYHLSPQHLYSACSVVNLIAIGTLLLSRQLATEAWQRTPTDSSTINQEPT